MSIRVECCCAVFWIRPKRMHSLALRAYIRKPFIDRSPHQGSEMLLRITALWSLCWLALSVPTSALSAEPIDFERDVRPVLQERCVACHGATKQKGGLRLDAKRVAFKGGDSGAVLVSGKSVESELVKRVVSSDSDERMPPDGERLSALQIERLKRWIDAGASWPESIADQAAERDRQLAEWVWQPVRSVSPPAASDARSKHDVDRFIGAKLAERVCRSPRKPIGGRSFGDCRSI